MTTEGLKEYRNRLDAERDSYFEDWPIDPGVREACRINLTGTLDALITLGPEASREAALGVLRRCIERFDELDEADEPFIITIEREELCDILYEIGGLCGLDSSDEWADEWRDW
jgi:hypothetical protein